MAPDQSPQKATAAFGDFRRYQNRAGWFLEGVERVDVDHKLNARGRFDICIQCFKKFSDQS